MVSTKSRTFHYANTLGSRIDVWIGLGPAPPPGAAPPAPGAPPGNPGMPPGIPPGIPPAPWYILVMMGLHIPSSSFCLCSYSSLSASWLESSHLMVSLHLSRIVCLSESEILSLSFSSSMVDFMLKQLLDGRYVKDSVSIDVEGDLDLRHATGRRGDTSELEFTEQVVILGHCALTLEYLDEYSGLVVGVGCESLSLLGGNSSVALDESGHDTTSGLDTERQRRHVEQQQILDLLRLVTVQNGGLYSGTVCYSLVGVNGFVKLLSIEEVLKELLHLGNTSRTTYKYDVVDL
ncbi:hypothetical protein SFRURICE_011671 [Spodoptera frugiperda]|nr:hypothetical protein SFRURICE_011671 [Spodoptera frugiperda]